MCKESKQELFAYYNERATEYEDVCLGKVTAISKPHLYVNDAAKIRKIVSSFGSGHIINIGCQRNSNNCCQYFLWMVQLTHIRANL